MVVDFFYYYDAIVCTALPFLYSFCCGIWNLAENCLKYGRFFGTLYLINKKKHAFTSHFHTFNLVCVGFHGIIVRE